MAFNKKKIEVLVNDDFEKFKDGVIKQLGLWMEEDIEFRYKDEDGDEITLNTDFEWKDVIQR